MKNSSRVSKYKEIREAIREEAGINQETIVDEQADLEDDEFLSFVNSRSKVIKYENIIDDTITEAKTFEQLSEESNAEIDKALKSAKSNVGKEEHHNTRLDILNKIRNPEKEVIKIDKMENLNTEQFSKGYFINNSKNEEDHVTIPADTKNVEEPDPRDFMEGEKKKITLLERLAAMSPKEDVKRAQIKLKQQDIETVQMEEEEPPKQVLDSHSVTQETKAITLETSGEKNEENEENEKVLTILNYAIIALIAVFVVICIMIVYQIFF